MKFNKISVIGLGYIGLPTAALFASCKVEVLGLDINEHVVATINKGDVHIVEPDLDGVVHTAVERGFLKASQTPEPADAFIIAVPTPFKDNHEPDLKYIEQACKLIAPVLKPGDLIVLESTSPVGTTQLISEWLSALRSDLLYPHKNPAANNIYIAHCPERVLPGKVMYELIHNDRIIGGLTPKCSELSVELYRVFLKGNCFVTDAKTAEMAKLTENSFRDVNIAFANELSMICDELNINVWELIKLSNLHPRVNILNPGPGVGGHCIAVDPWFIVSKSPEKARLISTARNVNDSKIDFVLEKVNQAIEQIGRDKVAIACLGLSYKANIDDLRESPALEIVKKLNKLDVGKLNVVEPNISSLPTILEGDMVELTSLDKALRDSEIILILVDHNEFLDLKSTIPGKEKVIVDTTGVLQK